MIIRLNFCQFCAKTYIVTPHLNRLDETVQERGHNMVSKRIRKIIPQLSSYTPPICSSGIFCIQCILKGRVIHVSC